MSAGSWSRALLACPGLRLTSSLSGHCTTCPPPREEPVGAPDVGIPRAPEQAECGECRAHAGELGFWPPSGPCSELSDHGQLRSRLQSAGSGPQGAGHWNSFQQTSSTWLLFSLQVAAGAQCTEFLSGFHQDSSLSVSPGWGRFVNQSPAGGGAGAGPRISLHSAPAWQHKPEHHWWNRRARSILPRCLGS